MATHPSILTWRIPRTEEPSRLHGVAKVRHDLVTKPPRPSSLRDFFSKIHREWSSSLLFWITWWDCRIFVVLLNYAMMSDSSFCIWIGQFDIEIRQMPIEEDLDRHQHGQQEPCQCRNVGPCQGKLRTTLKWKKKKKNYRVLSVDY